MNVSVSPVIISLLIKKARQQRDVLGINKNKICVYEQLPYPMNKYGVSVRIGGNIFSEMQIELFRIPVAGAHFYEWCSMAEFSEFEGTVKIAKDMSKRIKDDMRPDYKYKNTDTNAKYIKRIFDNFVF